MELSKWGSVEFTDWVTERGNGLDWIVGVSVVQPKAYTLLDEVISSTQLLSHSGRTASVYVKILSTSDLYDYCKTEH
jgi:hypothetical protein